MTDFVDIPFTTTASDLADAAIDYLQARWPGWNPEDGDPEVILIELFGGLTVEATAMAANMPKQALIQLGVQLLGQPYGQGSPATTNVTFTVVDNAGYTIPAGAQLAIDGYAFALTDDLTIPPGSTTGTAEVASTVDTAAANDLTGASVSPVSMPGFVTAYAVLAPTANGSDPQTDDDYVSQISRDRRLNSRAIITTLDFELVALDNPAVARAHAETTAERNVTVTTIDQAGNNSSTTVKNALLAIYQDQTKRLVNVTVAMADPTRTAVSVAYTVEAEDGYDHADLLTRINDQLTATLSWSGWAAPSSTDPAEAPTTWQTMDHVYLNVLIKIIGNVLGVKRVVSLTINGSAADLALPGAVPIPTPGTFTGTVA